MRTDDLDYELDPTLVATRPVEPRDAARLMVVPADGAPPEHRRVRDLPELLRAGDALVINRTRVVPARIHLRRASGGVLEGLVLPPEAPGRIACLLKGARRLREGEALELRGPEDRVVGVLEVLGREGDQVLLGIVEGGSIDALLEAAGTVPLPPYILGARRERPDDGLDAFDARDRAWYRTVYQAADSTQRSVAAPTAGLHFTPGLLESIEARGVHVVPVELEVGPGTFKPVATDHLEDHPMHRERYVVEEAARERLHQVRASGGRLLAVGTTTCRVLESLPDRLRGPTLAAETGLLIAPGHVFRHVDGLLTNFHLPRSTLLALVAARIGLERLREVYIQAIAHRYRFYSYGDAMLVP